MSGDLRYSVESVSYCSNSAGHRARGYFVLGPDGYLECGYCLVEAQRRGLAPIRTGSSPGGTGSYNDLLSSPPRPTSHRPVTHLNEDGSRVRPYTYRKDRHRGPDRGRRVLPSPTDTRPSEGPHRRRCPFCDREFRTLNGLTLYCSATHRKSDWRRRRRDTSRTVITTTQPQGTEP